MNIFRSPPFRPYWGLWTALVVGCSIGSIVLGVPNFLRDPYQSLSLIVFCFGVAFTFGAAVILVAMPILWLLIRIGYAGPISPILFSAILAGVAYEPNANENELFFLYIGCVLVTYLIVAYTRMFSNKSTQPTCEDARG